MNLSENVVTKSYFALPTNIDLADLLSTHVNITDEEKEQLRIQDFG